MTGIAIFLGAFLLFSVQPLAGKIITPLFGGAAAVWCLLLVFFQLIVLAGYATTYGLARLPARAQSVAFCVVWVAGVAFMANPAPWFCQPTDAAHPEVSLARMTIATLGLPCLCLATVSGMLQLWHKRNTGKDPYSLYSISNVGSLSALLLFPTLVEPLWPTSVTVNIWRACFVVEAALCAWIAVRSHSEETQASRLRPSSGTETQAGSLLPSSGTETQVGSPRSSAAQMFAYWCGLSALGSALLIEVTAFITQDLAPAPLLWIPPLAMYLLTFIFAFAGEKYYKRKVTVALVLTAAAAFPLVDYLAVKLPLWISLCEAGVLLLSGCMMCHGELYANRPRAERLPIFYLAIAVGGVVGGLGTMLLAPLILQISAERLLILMVLIGVATYVSIKVVFRSTSVHRAWACVLPITIAVGAISPCLAFWLDSLNNRTTIAEERNFYGAVKIAKIDGQKWLYHGKTIHGMQFVDPLRKKEVISYYTGAPAAVDETMRSLRDGPLNYGIVGLGAGSMAAYGQAGDSFTFYELDPKIEPIARRYFTFLQDTPAHVQVVQGDARQSLLHAQGRLFDLLVVDAFNSDAIPVHLMTVQALRLYADHVAPDGAILLHTTNKYVSLDPVLAAAAQQLGLKNVLLTNAKTHYVLLTMNGELLDRLADPCDKLHVEIWTPKPARTRPWTDDFSDLLSAFRHR